MFINHVTFYCIIHGYKCEVLFNNYSYVILFTDTFLNHHRLNSWSWSVYKNHKRCCSSNSKNDQSGVKDAGVQTTSDSAASSDDVPTTQPELRTVVKGLSCEHRSNVVSVLSIRH